MASLFIEIIGWIGTVLILMAYFLLTQGKLNGESKVYHSLNLFGGLGIITNSIFNSAYPPAGLNMIWSLVAIYGIIRGLKLLKKR